MEIVILFTRGGFRACVWGICQCSRCYASALEACTLADRRRADGDIGSATCEGFPGNAGHFQQDAQQMAEWGVDAYKVDGCNADVNAMSTAYPLLGRALNDTGRPMIYSCSWPDYERYSSVPVDFELVASTCNSWRIFWDVQAGQYAHTQAEKFDCVNGVSHGDAKHGAYF